MHITGIRLINFGPFAGDNYVSLEPVVYSIIARDSKNPKRSNWLGKSTFLESIPFALFGVHSKAQSLISHGKDEGGVILTLSDGNKIKRTINKGKMSLVYSTGIDYTGKVAQEKIETSIGLSKQDFYASCFVAQRKLAKLVLCEPSERFATVASWLALDRLQACEKKASEQVIRTNSNVQSAEISIGSASSEVFTIGNTFGVKFGKPEDVLVSLTEKLDDIRGKVTSLTQEAESKSKTDSSIIESYNNAIEDLDKVQTMLEMRESSLRGSLTDFKSNKEHFQSVLPDSSSLIEDTFSMGVHSADEYLLCLQTLLRNLETDIKETRHLLDEYKNEKVSLSVFNFNGSCPVTSLPCPDKENVAKHAKGQSDRSNDLRGNISRTAIELQRKEDLRDKLRYHCVSVTNDINFMQTYSDKRDTLTKRLKSPEYSTFDGIHKVATASIERDLEYIEKEISDLRQQSKMLERSVSRAEQLIQSIDTNRKSLDIYKRELEISKYAALAFGKQGAQKVLATRALEFMENRANDFLQAADIGLTIAVKWETELDSLSKVCYSCGYEYPKTKLKICPVCSKERQNKISDKLTFDISDRSGAAEDLAGMAFQVAASQYLKERKGSMFSSLMLDEPFGQLDEHNRHSIVTRFLNVLGLAGFEQSFIVAHHNNISHSMPGCIEIVSNDGVSSVRVVNGEEANTRSKQGQSSGTRDSR